MFNSARVMEKMRYLYRAQNLALAVLLFATILEKLLDKIFKDPVDALVDPQNTRDKIRLYCAYAGRIR